MNVNITFNDFILSKEMKQCTTFVKLANKQHPLTDAEVKNYRKTLLSKYYLTVLNSEQILKWNFPIFADIFKLVL